MSIDGWIDKEDVVHIYNGILLTHEKEGNPVICNNVDEPGGHYAEWNEPDREGQILHGITYMWNLKKQVKLIEMETRKVVAGGWMMKETGRGW